MATEQELGKLILGRGSSAGISQADPNNPAVLSIPSARRLLVLIPEIYFLENPTIVATLRELASQAGATINLLCLVAKAEDELRFHHRLETFAAILRTSHTLVSTSLECSDNWHKAVQSNWQPGDLIVCPVEHTIKTGIFHRTRVLAQVIVEDLHKTVYALSF